MSDDNQQFIALNSEKITQTIKEQVKNEIDNSIAGHSAFTHAPELLESIKSIQDPQQQAALFNKYLGILEEHQKVKNAALPKLVDSVLENKKTSLDNELENKKKVLNVEMEKDQARTTLFTNKWILMFLMCFPIIIGSAVVLINESVGFASFIIVIWYGTLIGFYFSQSNALNKLLQSFSSK